MMQASAAALTHAANLGAQIQRPANDQSELIVDLFAGGGGASTAILAATGRHPDIAINHDPEAVALHSANHPTTRHWCTDIMEVDPHAAIAEFPGRKVGLLWASPDCKHHSKARGGKPREKNIRSLAWIVVRWAAQVRPRIIALENVEEFQDWGPLLDVDTLIRDEDILPMAAQADQVDGEGHQLALFDAPMARDPTTLTPARLYRAGQPDPRAKGVTFRRWVSNLEKFGYVVEWRELVAADYGAPTTRKRLFLIARCDGQPIVWPARTHAPRDKAEKMGLQPWLAASTIIDFTREVPSIFARKRPLEPKTHARIAKGIKRYVIEAPRPFIVPVTHSNGWNATRDGADPLPTMTTAKGGEFAVGVPYLAAQYGEREGQEPRTRDVDTSPYPTAVPGGNGGKLVNAVLGGAVVGCGGRAGQSPPRALNDPLGTATAKADKCVASATLAPFVAGTAFGDGRSRAGLRAWSAEDPARVVSASNDKAVAGAFMVRQFGTGVPQDLPAPMPTVMADGGGGKTQLVTAHLGRMTKGQVGSDLGEPAPTGTTHAKDTVAAVTIDKYYGSGVAANVVDPLDTATAKARFGINATYLEQANTGMVGHDSRDPVSTIVGKGCTQRVVEAELEGFEAEPSPRRAAVLAFLWEHFGEPTAEERANPLATAQARLRFGLVVIDGAVWRIVDIGMRMLMPRELYGAQGFPPEYIIDLTFEGRPLTKTAQTRMAGNSVSPPPATALLRANLPEWDQERMAA